MGSQVAVRMLRFRKTTATAALFNECSSSSWALEPGWTSASAGAGYVLRYSQGFDCRYNLSVIGSEGNEINLRLAGAVIPEGNNFKCLEGTLKRTTQN